MPDEGTIAKIRTDIATLKRFWYQRNRQFKEWYELLILIDKLASKGMESYVSNEPQTFYNMAHYLLTKGELSHSTPIEDESALELDRKAKVGRGCEYMWDVIDTERKLGGSSAFIDELSFYLLVLGWYSNVSQFDRDTGNLRTQLWSPMETYPLYGGNRLVSCVHSYKITESEAILKAEENMWAYTARGTVLGEVTLDDYFIKDSTGLLHNIILIDDRPVTEWVDRPDMRLLVAPVGGFPDKGSLTPGKRDWRKLTGRGIFEVNSQITEHFNKWKSMISQILRDTAQPITQEFSAVPQATPEQLRDRGAFFHYGPGEQGLVRVPPAAIPIEMQSHQLEIRRENQKGSFNDAVYGMVEGQPGYALSLLATSSANQILYPYMDGKHFVISENDKFWLSSLKTSKKVFEVKGKFSEKLKPTDIPEDVVIHVESDVATPKDWMERGTIANLLKDHLDEDTINSEILRVKDTQGIKRRKKIDKSMKHPMTEQIELIASYYSHADYLEQRLDKRQALLFRRAAQALEAQMGAPAPGQGSPAGASEAAAAVEAATPGEKARVSPGVSPPEARSGFTPQQLRGMVGRGSIR